MELIALLPFWYTVLVALGFGVIIGSFLNVVIYRFHTGKSLAGSSHCLSCQTPLRFYELFPLVSYLSLRGRCRSCSAHIPSRYFWVELLTGLLFVAVVLTLTPLWWPFGFFLVSLLVVVTVYDIYHLVIPQSFVWVLLACSVIAVGGEYLMLPDYIRVGEHLLAGFLAYGFFAFLWKVSQGRWIGYGDAKLAWPLGLLVGVSGMFSMIVLAFWVGTVISLGILLLGRLANKRGKTHLRFLATPLTMKSEVPFAPFLIAGFLLVYLGQIDVLALISYVLPF
jgi:prepilin signal peptidase PulO-like enzyme (type II secretory pathway)